MSTLTHPCRVCGRLVLSTERACATCRAVADVVTLRPVRVEPTPDGLIDALDELDREDEDKEWTGAYVDGVNEGY